MTAAQRAEQRRRVRDSRRTRRELGLADPGEDINAHASVNGNWVWSAAPAVTHRALAHRARYGGRR